MEINVCFQKKKKEKDKEKKEAEEDEKKENKKKEIKLEKILLYDPDVSLLNIYLKHSTSYCKDIWSSLFIVVFSTRASKWKEPRCQST